MYWLYSLLLFLYFLVYIPVAFVRFHLLKREPLFLARRLGLRRLGIPPEGKVLWIHAVSVGEVLSLQNLVRTLKAKHPDWIMYCSCLTNTGYRLAKEKLEADGFFFIPLDFRWVVRRFFRHLRPEVLVITESEFWPNLLREAARLTRGVVLVNGRISDRSFSRYKRIKPFTRRVLSSINQFLVQTERDREMFVRLGIPPDRIHVAGNLKAEIDLPHFSAETLAILRSRLNIPDSARVVTAGSLHPGEEELLLEAFSRARKKNPDLRLILAPRHPSRAAEVEQECRRYPVALQKKSSPQLQPKWDVLIVDTLGELPEFYAVADAAFVGGSLVPVGGHNLLEPAYYAKPIFFGPHMQNFSHLAEIFIQMGAATVVRGLEDLARMFASLAENELQQAGEKARATLESLRGATEKTVRTIEKLMAR